MTGQRGFTLLEVVAAVALTGLVVLVLAGAQFGATRSISALSSADSQVRERMLYRRLRTDLEQAYSSRRSDLPAFRGEVDQLKFLTRQGPTGLTQVEYRITRERLERTSVSWLAPDPEGKEVTATATERRGTWPLRENEEVRFRYLSSTGGWSSRWSFEVEQSLPVAIEIQIGESSWVFPLHNGSVSAGGSR